ncbi:hypothetical protein C8R43DRAFT_908145 [Mycena crocata]|nr:hypothetical protein C8R43DRAFT_908145 [Mycena crocata]
MVREFYPERGAGAQEPPEDAEYPEPKWRCEPISEEQLHRVVAKMKPWKVTRTGSFPNSVYKKCAALLIPRLQRIYAALIIYEHEPEDWLRTETFVGRKPGKPDYTAVGAHCPLTLSHGHARLRNTAKNLQVATNAEFYDMLPSNQFGGRPGRTGVDMVQGIVMWIKDAWRKGEVVSLLL